MGGWPTPTLPLRLQLDRLEALGLPNASGTVLDHGGRLRFDFSVKPHSFAREYCCRLELRIDGKKPDASVLRPDLQELAGRKPPPHIYDYAKGRTKLCLFMPGSGEWTRQCWLADTMLPWTAEWLRFYEIWLDTGEWEGGGEHPGEPRRRYGIPGRRPRAHA